MIANLNVMFICPLKFKRLKLKLAQLQEYIFFLTFYFFALYLNTVEETFGSLMENAHTFLVQLQKEIVPQRFVIFDRNALLTYFID